MSLAELAIQGAGHGFVGFLIRILPQVIVIPGPVAVGHGRTRVKLDGLGVIVDGILILTKCAVRPTPVVVDHGIIRVKLDGRGVVVYGRLVLV